MSGVGIAQSLLSTNAGLIAVVAATRIKSGVLPLNTVLPAISLTTISAQQYNTLAQNSATYLVQERVQVTVLAATYPLVKSILALVRAALPQTRGTVNGFACDAIYPDTEGPDLYDDITLTHESSVDYRITFRR